MSIDLQNLNEQLRELQPPSARDRLIFEAVVVKGRGQCAVAAEQGISQPRVSQIVAEVGGWLDRSLPRGRQNESTGGGMAVGEYVAMAQIDFLLQQTLHDITESKKDKVTEKAGTRGVVQWTETKTEGRQIVPVGLLNVALRLSLAKAKLAGVDVTGRRQREMALAEERQRQEAMQGEVRGQRVEVRKEVETKEEVRRDEEAKAKKPLIKKSENSAVAAEVVQPQVQAEAEDKLCGEREEFIKNTACKQLINHLRSDPRCAGWTEKQIREHAQFIWDTQEEDTAVAAKLAWSQRADPHPGPLPRGEGEESGNFSQGNILPVSGGTKNRQPESRRHRDKRHSPQERRRNFLAPLAVG